MRLAAERPAPALILEAPFTGVDDVAAALAPMFARASPVVLTDHFVSRDWIAKAHMPVLVIQGDAHSVVPFEEGQRLYAMANAPKHFVRLIGGGHTTLVRDGEYDYIWPLLAEHPAGS